MEGYWQRPEETADVMLPGGWLRTGDIGRMDEDGLRVDRRPQEGHDPRLRLQRVSERDRERRRRTRRHTRSCGDRRADERSGEVVKMFAVRKDASVDEQHMLDHCRENLTGYKRPETRRVPRRTAEDQCRQDSPARTTGRIRDQAEHLTCPLLSWRGTADSARAPHQPAPEIVRVDVRRDAVTQVEHMSGPVTVAGQSSRHALTDNLRALPQRCRDRGCPAAQPCPARTRAPARDRSSSPRPAHRSPCRPGLQAAARRPW